MFENEFKSSLAPHITEFLLVKQAMGYNIKRYRIALTELDEILSITGSSTIRQEDMVLWKKSLINNSSTTIYQKSLCIRVFARYLRSCGLDAYISQVPKHLVNGYTPYIYSMKEISTIFTNVDRLVSDHFTINNNIFAIPILLRLLYATGLRISEAIALKNEDIDFQRKEIRVKGSKNSQERILPVSDSLAAALEQYNQFKRKLNCKPSSHTPEYNFLISSSGKKLNQGSVGRWFRKVLKMRGIPFVGECKGPRIHDFRHTFAVHALMKMVKEDKNIDLYLPVLSAYLGHKHLTSTDHYIRLTAEMFPDLQSKMEKLSSYIFPSI